jgi:hypothetical protein
MPLYSKLIYGILLKLLRRICMLLSKSLEGCYLQCAVHAMDHYQYDEHYLGFDVLLIGLSFELASHFAPTTTSAWTFFPSCSKTSR